MSAYKHYLRLLAGFVILISGGLLAQENSGGADPERKKLIYVMEIRNDIDPRMNRRTDLALQEAKDLNADLVIIDMNTYGGAVYDANDIRSGILNFEKPVYVFVNDNAASAGALISIACDSIYMAPGASIGAATVVTADGQAAPEPVPPPTEPADITPVPSGRGVSEDGSTVRIEDGRAAFVLPSGNISCVLSDENAVCQIIEKTYDVRADFMMPDLIGDECTTETADAMTLTNDPHAWTCAPEDLAPSARVDRLGWWAQELEGETLDADAGILAVLPYGSTMVAGPVSCQANENGVTCRHTELGNREIILARETYWIQRF